MLRHTMCFGALLSSLACAPTIPKVGAASDAIDDDFSDVPAEEEEPAPLPNEDDPGDPEDEPPDEPEDVPEGGFAYAGTYLGEMLVMIAGSTDEGWSEICENGAEWQVDDNGDLDGEVLCDLFFDGQPPQPLEVIITGGVDDDGTVEGALFYSVEGPQSGSAEFRGTVLDREMVFVGETDADLGREERTVTFEFDGGRR